MAGARPGMCELTHGMAGKQHGHGMLSVNRPLELSKVKKHMSVNGRVFFL